ncbi:MAG: acetamidase/formamidase family protein, partial [Acidobacteriales bacterium]|nr:acetamidase/formamidase family protein [Terriglobales bacterium]
MLAAFVAAAVSLAYPQQLTLTGRWNLKVDWYGTTLYFPLRLEQQGTQLTGDLSGDILQGTVTKGEVKFLAKDKNGGSEDVTGAVRDRMLEGNVVWIEDGDPRLHHLTFTAERVPEPRAGAPQTHEFTATKFYRRFSPDYEPVLHIWPGDSIHTTTVDAGGTDEKGVARSLGGNPETGPFYIEGASPGDTLVVHVDRLKLNRNYAISDDSLVARATNPELAVRMKDTGKQVNWHLDLEKGLASIDTPGEHLARYSVPTRPMLGCIATAPPPSNAPPGTGDSGHFGGNMDFNEIVEGPTVYLPVSVPGAYLYFGDGHALQGDGELNGNALETSMDVMLTVDVIAGKELPNPRVESATHIMAMGLEGSVDEAVRAASANMAGWLTDSYGLT